MRNVGQKLAAKLFHLLQLVDLFLLPGHVDKDFVVELFERIARFENRFPRNGKVAHFQFPNGIVEFGDLPIHQDIDGVEHQKERQQKRRRTRHKQHIAVGARHKRQKNHG